MPDKFIPDSDSAFANRARCFADRVLRDPAKYLQSPEDAQRIADAVAEFRSALAANYSRATKSMRTKMLKDQTRAVAEKLVREAGSIIRASSKIDAASKMLVGIQERPARLRKRECPQNSPELSFAGERPFSSTIDGKHTLKFRDRDGKLSSNAKPEGATRIELFIDLIPPGEPIPREPGRCPVGVSRYVRSYSRSPFTVKYLKADVPLRVIYYARWANETGDFGEFSPPLSARFEGYDILAPLLGNSGKREQTVIVTSGRKALPNLIDGEHVQSPPIEGQHLLSDDRSEAA